MRIRIENFSVKNTKIACLDCDGSIIINNTVGGFILGGLWLGVHPGACYKSFSSLEKTILDNAHYGKDKCPLPGHPGYCPFDDKPATTVAAPLDDKKPQPATTVAAPVIPFVPKCPMVYWKKNGPTMPGEWSLPREVPEGNDYVGCMVKGDHSYHVPDTATLPINK